MLLKKEKAIFSKKNLKTLQVFSNLKKFKWQLSGGSDWHTDCYLTIKPTSLIFSEAKRVNSVLYPFKFSVYLALITVKPFIFAGV